VGTDRDRLRLAGRRHSREDPDVQARSAGTLRPRRPNRKEARQRARQDETETARTAPPGPKWRV